MGLILLLLAGASSPSWAEVRSDHFRVVSDASEAEARNLASELERIRSIYQSVLGPEVESEGLIPVFAAADSKGFRALLPERWREEGAKRWAGLFIEAPSGYAILLRLDLRGRVDSSFVGNTRPVVRHEGAEGRSRAELTCLLHER